MAMTQAELVAEVQVLTGRENDTALIIPARITRFLNEGQTVVARKCLGHIDLETKDPDAMTLVTATYSYSFTALSPAVLHPIGLFYMDGASSQKLTYKETDTFDEDYPDPTQTSGIPQFWTRRGSTIEVWPPPSSSENGKYLRLDYSKAPTAFTVAATTATCTMAEADKGLIYYAASESFRAIGNKVTEADDQKKWFYEWLDEYQRDKDGLFMNEANVIFD
jgi:hypothetical protein